MKKNSITRPAGLHTALALMLVIPQMVMAVDFDINPGINLQTHITDNLDLGNDKRLTAVAEANPQIRLNAKSMRTTTTLDYTLQNRITEANRQLQMNHQASGSSELKLIKDYLIAFGQGSLTQRSETSTQTQLIDSSMLFRDYSNVGNVVGGFKAQNHSRRFVSTNADYQYGISRSEGGLYADTESHKGSLVFENGESTKKFTWKLQSSGDLQKNTQIEDRFTQISSVDLGYLLQKNTGVALSAGYEFNPGISNVGSDKTRGYLATVTGFWQVGPQLSTKAMYGRRSFGQAYLAEASWQDALTLFSANVSREAVGNTYSANLTRRFKQLQFNISYSENLTNYTYLELERAYELSFNADGTPNIDPRTGMPVILENITTLQNAGSFIRRIGRSNATFTGQHNVISLTASIEHRDFVESDIEGFTRNVNLNWRINFTPRSTFIVNASAQDLNDDTLAANDIYGNLKIQYQHKLGEHTTAGITLNHWERYPESTAKITANMATLNLAMTM